MDFDFIWKLLLGLFAVWVLNQSIPQEVPPRYNYYQDSTEVACSHDALCSHPVMVLKLDSTMFEDDGVVKWK